MSSSGLIYAFIVGAWAVYLVPMWLRREDELNEARQTRRYTTAIKVLSHKDSFERRYGRVAEAGETAEARLPVAVGQGAAPESGRDTLERVRAKEREQARPAAGAARGSVRGSARDASAQRRGAAPAGGSKAARTRKPASAAVPATSSSARRSVVHASVAGVVASGGQMSGASAAPGMPIGAMNATSPMVRARRRRVVGVLFAVTSLGAIVSMDLGLRFVWAMLVPAAVLSAYIVWVRKDERARAAERARHRAAAARAAREAREAQRRDQEESVRAQGEREEFEREEQARREATARRRAAAARSRAERRVSGLGPGAAPANPGTDPRDLPRAANG